MKRKLLTILLSLTMIMISMTNVVLADNNQVKIVDTDASYSTIQAAVNAATNNQTIMLYANCTENVSIPSGKVVTIDLNGHVLSAPTSGGSVITVNGNLTLTDNNPTEEHKFNVNSDLWVLDEVNGTHTISGGIITGGKGNLSGSEYLGGGVYIASGGTLEMDGGTIVGCSATKGGGVFSWGTFTMNNSSAIIGCTATVDGGGVCACKCSFAMNDNSKVSECVADNGAGGVYIWGDNSEASFTMNGNSIISNCEASATHSNKRSGGGVCVEGNLCSFTMNGGNIINNIANNNNNGGGVQVFSGTFTMNGGTINQNNAGYGGGIHVNGGAKVNITNGYIKNNHTSQSGGAVQVDGDFIMSGGTIEINKADNDGGGLSVNGNSGKAILTGTAKIINNTANNQGGGVSYYNNPDKVFLGGSVQITGNVKGGEITNDELSGGSTNNVYLYASTLYVTLGTSTNGSDGNEVFKPAEGMRVGITSIASPTDTTPVKITNNGTADDEKYFISDNANYIVKFNNNHLELTHTHNNITFFPWTDQSKLPDKQGNYFLYTDVTLNSTWTVPTGETNLCLNGHVIKQTKGNSRVINVPNGATLNLYDCGTAEHIGYIDTNGLWHLGTGTGTPKTISGGIITGGSGVGYGGGVETCGTFTMNGGTIMGNTADAGGGVDAASNGKFILNNGTISGNIANNNGGGVIALGEFDMNGGTIEYNKVTTNNYSYWGGGGVAVYSDGKATLFGGTIRYNSSNAEGGGLIVLYNNNSRQKVSIAGVSITENTAVKNGGGVYVTSDGLTPIVVGGGTKITGNVTGGEIVNGALSGGTINNFYLLNDKYIELGTGGSAPNQNMLVCITKTIPTTSNSIKITTNGTANDVNYFTSDNADYMLTFNSSNHLELAKIVAYNCTKLKEYPTLAKAIGEAVSGDEIELRADNNAENIVLPNGVTLYAKSGYTGTVTTNVTGKAIAKQEMFGSFQYKYSVANLLTITYKDQGNINFSGSHENGYPTTFMAEVPTQLKAATKNGYTFGGWFDNVQCNGNPITNFYAYTYTDNLTLYAKWTKNSGYTITKGNDARININDNKDFSFTSNADFIRFDKVKVDDIAITKDTDYIVEEGSTKVTLKASYLNTLSVGEHTMDIISYDGHASTTFTITKNSPSPKPEYNFPNTGINQTDSNNHSLLKISSLSLLTVGTYLVIKKKKDN